MVYGYIRVSTEKQTCENQKLEITRFAKQRELSEVNFIDEKISGTVKIKNRKLGGLITTLQEGDVLIVTELSRLGRTLIMILDTLEYLLEKKVIIYAIKEGFEFSDNIQSKVIAFAFGLSAEIERKLISERTIQGLNRVRAEGKKLGHRPGQKNSKTKLMGKKKEIKSLVKEGLSVIKIAKCMNVSKTTIYSYLRENKIKRPF